MDVKVCLWGTEIERESENTAESHFNKNPLLYRDRLIPKLIPKLDFGIQRDNKDREHASLCVSVHVCLWDNRITGVASIQELEMRWWCLMGWGGGLGGSETSQHKTNTQPLTYAHPFLLIICKCFHLKVTEPAWRSLPGVMHSSVGAINRCSSFWPLSAVSHWIYSLPPRCHIKFIPPASEVRLSHGTRGFMGT